MIAKGCIHLVLCPFIIGLALFLITIFLLPSIVLALVATFILLLCCGEIIFFRDHERPTGKGIVAPADGVIKSLRTEKDWLIISTFMNIYDVHVNRAPISGRVRSIINLRGRFAPAYSSEARKNARILTILETELGTVKIMQIAGIFARRIVNYLQENENVIKGQRIGIIRFGSRVELYLPKEKVRAVKKEGDRVFAGLTTVAVCAG